ncbi:hypothetical protein IGK47_004617 [Enterococcus sp. AZ007]
MRDIVIGFIYNKNNNVRDIASISPHLDLNSTRIEPIFNSELTSKLA